MNIRGRPCQCLALLLVATVAASRGDAQPADAAAMHAGSFVMRPDEQLEVALGDAASRRSALALADQLVAILRRTPALASPVGYSTIVSRPAGSAPAGYDTGMPYHAAVVGALSYFMTQRSASGTATFTNNGGNLPFAIYANMAACEERSTIDTARPLDGGPPVMTGYRRTGEFRGHPVYNGSCVVIAGAGEPLEPVSTERYLRLAVLALRAKQASHRSRNRADAAGGDQRVAAVERMGDSLEAARIADVEAQIAAMSPAVRRRQAAVFNEGQLMPSDVDDADAFPLVQPNSSFFKADRPAGRATLIVVVLPGLQPEIAPPHDEMNDQRLRDVARIVAQLDWAALEAMVRP